MHPNLLLSQAEIAEIRRKVEQYPWAQEAYRLLKANADAWAARTEIAVPETGGGFYHAADATAYRITEAHYRHADAARDLGLMFQLTGDGRYVRNARAILLDYADKYLTYEIHDKEGRTGDRAEAGGRATPQGINEATWVISLAWAYDLLYNELAPAERAAIETRVLRPAAEIIMDNNEGRHNHQTWYNAGVGVIGFALDDPALIWYALDKPDSGLRFQMQASITPEGMWYEGSMHYQFYVLKALFPLLEAAYHAGIDLYQQEPAYKRLFDFMLDYADADLRLPTFNDGRVAVLSDPDRAPFYEVAYRRLGDPRYATVLRSYPRTDLLALLYGVAEVPQVAPLPWRSRYFQGANLAVLRSDAGQKNLQAVLNTLGYQGGHSHPDQLGLVFHGLGTVLAPDAGSIKYRMPAHVAYFKQSIAHNLLVVDGQSQARTPPPAVQAFAGGHHLQLVRAITTDAYPGVNLVRTLLLTDDYLVDIFQAESAAEHTYDWVYRNRGEFTTDALDFQPTGDAPGTGHGYEYLQHIRAAEPWSGGIWHGTWQLDPNCHVRATLLGAAGDRYFLADSLIAADQDDEIADYTLPVLIARRRTRATRFVALLEPYQSQPQVHGIQPLALYDGDDRPLALEDGVALELQRGKARELLILDDTDRVKRAEALASDARQIWARFEGGQLRALYLGMGSEASGANWRLRLESLAAVPDIQDVALLLELTQDSRAQLQNCSFRPLGVELEGLLSGSLEIWQLDQDSQRHQAVRPSQTAAGFARFEMFPQTVYEVVGT